MPGLKPRHTSGVREQCKTGLEAWRRTIPACAEAPSTDARRQLARDTLGDGLQALVHKTEPGAVALPPRLNSQAAVHADLHEEAGEQAFANVRIVIFGVEIG
eukprot:scaffold104979_cov28-Tisochrysis_lutea.AAC.3